MTNEFFNKIRLYKNTMAWMKLLLKNGTISDEEYAIIDTKIAEKYGLNSSIIYRWKPLTYLAFRANIWLPIRRYIWIEL